MFILKGIWFNFVGVCFEEKFKDTPIKVISAKRANTSELFPSLENLSAALCVQKFIWPSITKINLQKKGDISAYNHF